MTHNSTFDNGAREELMRRVALHKARRKRKCAASIICSVPLPDFFNQHVFDWHIAELEQINLQCRAYFESKGTTA